MEIQENNSKSIKPPSWKNITEEQQPFLLKEIEIIQNQIKKFDEYSLIVKGWSITLWTALLFFTINQISDAIKLSILGLSIGSLFLFWLIDTYFKFFQRISIARSCLISDYLNEETPDLKTNQEFIFRIYDPMGRISKKRKVIATEKRGKMKKEKRKDNYYWKNYLGRFRFLKAFIVRIVSTLYCILIEITLFLIWFLSQDLLFFILMMPVLCLLIFSFILSHQGKL